MSYINTRKAQLKNLSGGLILSAVILAGTSTTVFADLPGVTYPVGSGSVTVLKSACSEWTNTERFDITVEESKEEIVTLDFSSDELDFTNCNILLTATIQNSNGLRPSNGWFGFFELEGLTTIGDGARQEVSLTSDQINFKVKPYLDFSATEGSFSVIFTATSSLK